MKRLPLLLIILLLASCGPIGTDTPATETSIVQPSPLPPVEEATRTLPMPPVIGNPPAGAAACDNVYMPVVSGATWNYSLAGQVSDTYTHSVLSVSESSFVEQDVFGSGVSRTGEWSCDAGNLTALDPTGGGASVSTEGQSSVFTATSNTGITFPADPKPGDSWTQSVTLEGSQTINGFNVPATNQVTVSCTVIGFEPVTVPAGTFEALRVDCVNDMVISVVADGNPFSTTSTSWYAANVGMVKSVTVGNGLDSTIELLSYSLPQR